MDSNQDKSLDNLFDQEMPNIPTNEFSQQGNMLYSPNSLSRYGFSSQRPDSGNMLNYSGQLPDLSSLLGSGTPVWILDLLQKGTSLPVLDHYLKLYVNYYFTLNQFMALHSLYGQLFKNGEAAKYVLKSISSLSDDKNWYDRYLSNVGKSLKDPRSQILSLGQVLAKTQAGLMVQYNDLLHGLMNLNYNVDLINEAYERILNELAKDYDEFFIKPVTFAIKGALLEDAYLTVAAEVSAKQIEFPKK